MAKSKYDAFIPYNQAADISLANALEKAPQTFANRFLNFVACAFLVINQTSHLR